MYSQKARWFNKSPKGRGGLLQSQKLVVTFPRTQEDLQRLSWEDVEGMQDPRSPQL